MIQSYYRWLRSVMQASRRKRFATFRALCPIAPHERILDVGGTPSFWTNSGLEAQVTILNIRLPNTRPAPFQWVESDACHMDGIGDQAFDLVFSNSVIEHVGDYSRQMQFASEVRRVAARYWIQTPNRYFPIEPHFMFPFFQFLPLRAKYAVAQHWPFSHAWQYGRPTAEVATIRLLTEAEMTRLFPGARILRERMLGLVKSITVYSV